MRPKKRGIAEESVCIFNPLPDVEDTDLLKIAKLDELTIAAKRSPFILEWKYSGGLEGEYIELKPGERRVLRASDARLWLKAVGEKGGVVHPMQASETQVRKLAAEGIQRAIKFYKDRGPARLPEVRKKLGLTKEEMEEARHEHWAYYMNAARAEVLERRLRELRSPSKAAA
jgi:hypothetical protein